MNYAKENDEVRSTSTEKHVSSIPEISAKSKMKSPAQPQPPLQGYVDQ
jgi:hypothetical protein